MSAISPAVSACGIDRARMERDRAGADRHPAAVVRRDRLAAFPCARGARLASGVRELDAGHRTAAADDRREPRQQRLMLRVPQAEAVRRDAADRRDVRRFGEHDAGAAHRPRAEMLHVPVVAEPVDGGILAHRRHHDAVARGDGTEADRLEQKRRCHAGHGPCGCVARSIAANRARCQSASGAMPFWANSRRALSVLSSSRPMPRMTCGALVNWMSL